MAAVLRPAPAQRTKPKAEQPTPDAAALEVAHSMLRSSTPLHVMLANPAMRRVVEHVARKHMKRRDRIDIKKIAAGDDD